VIASIVHAYQLECMSEQTAFPKEDLQEVALTKKKHRKAKESEKKTQLNKLMGKKV